MSAWQLLDAPPWEAESVALGGTTAGSTRLGKRKVAELSESEVALGKLASKTAVRLRALGWRRTITELRGSSNVSSTVHALPH